MNDKLDKLLSRDGLAEAERMTGNSYKDDELTMKLGFCNHINIGKKKKEALKKNLDTYWGQPLNEFLDTVRNIGFTEIYSEQFKKDGYDYSDKLYIFWRKGVLLKFDTFGGNCVNGGNFYFNYVLEDDGHFPISCTLSFCDRVYVGDKDCREGLRHYIDIMESRGHFLESWKTEGHVWLTNYAESFEKASVFDFSGYYEATLKRIKKFPVAVQKCLSVVIKKCEEEISR